MSTCLPFQSTSRLSRSIQRATSAALTVTAAASATSTSINPDNQQKSPSHSEPIYRIVDLSQRPLPTWASRERCRVYPLNSEASFPSGVVQRRHKHQLCCPGANARVITEKRAVEEREQDWTAAGPSQDRLSRVSSSSPPSSSSGSSKLSRYLHTSDGRSAAALTLCSQIRSGDVGPFYQKNLQLAIDSGQPYPESDPETEVLRDKDPAPETRSLGFFDTSAMLLGSPQDQKMLSLCTNQHTSKEPASLSREKGKMKDTVDRRREPLWCHSLTEESISELLRKADRIIKSGERSLPQVVNLLDPSLSPRQGEEIQCLILDSMVAERRSPSDMEPLYLSTLKPPSPFNPQGSVEEWGELRKLQRSVLHRIFGFFVFHGRLIASARVLADPRIKVSQGKFLLGKLLNVLSTYPSLESKSKPFRSSHAKAKVEEMPSWEEVIQSLNELSRASVNLMERGAVFESAVLQRAMLLLAWAGQHDLVSYLAEAARDRMQEERVDGQSLSANGNQSNPRILETRPLIIPIKGTEKVMDLLCRNGGESTAYRLLQMIPPARRTRNMYNSLMRRYGNARVTLKAGEGPVHFEPTSPDEEQPGLPRSRWRDAQLWNELCTLDHLGGPNLQTFTSRIAAHGAIRDSELIRQDLALIQKLNLAKPHQLGEETQLTIVKTLVSGGHLMSAYRHFVRVLNAQPRRQVQGPKETASSAVRTARHQPLSDGAKTELMNLLLAGLLQDRGSKGKMVRDPDPSVRSNDLRGPRGTPSRSERVRRMVIKVRAMSSKHGLRPDARTMALFIKALAQWDRFVSSDKLWEMMELLRALGCDGSGNSATRPNQSDLQPSDGPSKRNAPEPLAETADPEPIPGSSVIEERGRFRLHLGPLYRSLIRAFERRGDTERAVKVEEILLDYERHRPATTRSRNRKR
ncbi:hypothetical protein IE53DRAFT_390896 [Violaceomyces palustris]|uniref:Uncharacterized protein n=1 Tax=Violaceomyces palustris TaxID=1673888 RepID=A0ACD0NMI5_9BASI|nr:hypothetical protein IE53DRAFT_390896 [Violaceomyces palustris]